MKNLKEYFIKELGWGWHYQGKAVFQFLCDAAKFCEGGVILDAGAGHMRYKPFFDNCIYLSQEHSAGIDFKQMKKLKYDLVSPIDKNIPLRDNSVDGILSTSVIEHLRYPEAFFKEAFRVLKPGGKIFINVPFIHPEHEVPFDFQRPTRYGLERWLKDVGFQNCSIKPSTSSTESACAFIVESLKDDILKGLTRKELRKIFNIKALDIVKVARSMFSIFSFVTLKFVTNVFCRILKLFADRGAHEHTRFPVGWITIATKPGLYKKEYFKNKEVFLSKHLA